VGDPGSPGAALPRVVICDARPIVLAGLCSVLEGPGLVGHTDPDRAVEAVETLRPDVMVAGLRLDDPSVFSAVARVKATNHAPTVLLVADAATVTELREAVIAGVDSFLLTSAPAGEVRDAVVRTARGERVISPSIAMQLAGGWQRETHRQGAAALSPRELDVLGLLAEGLTNQQIGQELELSPRTVKTHVQNLLAKLESPDRTGAVARGFRLGLIR
jgi:DNA-binding NarL/FixJ family response regulator